METEEQWRPIPGFEDYEVSSLGRVMSYRRKTPRELQAHASVSAGCRIVALMPNDGTEQQGMAVARAMALAFLGDPGPGRWVAHHINWNGLDDTLSNIEWQEHDFWRLLLDEHKKEITT